MPQGNDGTSTPSGYFGVPEVVFARRSILDPMTSGERWRVRPSDIAVAASCTLFAVVDVLNPVADSLLAGTTRTVVALASSVILLFRRRWPMTIAIAQCLAYAFGYGPFQVVAGMYAAGRYYDGPERRVIALGVFAMVVDMAAWTVYASVLDFWSELLYGAGYIGYGALIGITGRRFAGVVAEREAVLESERDKMVELTKTHERERMADEVRDAVAHKVSSMMLDASALEVTAERGSQWVAGMANRIRSTGQDVLGEVRQLSGQLASGPAPLAPQQGIAQIPDMAEKTRRAWVEVTVSTSGGAPGARCGEPGGVSPGRGGLRVRPAP